MKTSAKFLATTSLGVALFLSACGSTAGSQPAKQFNQVVRDPDNSAYVGATLAGAATVTASGGTVRDQDNPYWGGSSKDANRVDAGQGRGLR